MKEITCWTSAFERYAGDVDFCWVLKLAMEFWLGLQLSTGTSY